MSSPVRSVKTTKTLIRRKSTSPRRKSTSPRRKVGKMGSPKSKSKSPRRNYSPSRVQPEIHLESEEPAYSDPVDYSRALSESFFRIVRVSVITIVHSTKCGI
jgi:hypothetical protein